MSLETESSTAIDPDHLKKLELNSVPRHVAIIPDGNRRWAQQRGVTSSLGHHMGAEGVVNIVAAARDLGVEYLTIYAFSTENWKRSQEEVETLMHLLALMLRKETPKMVKEGIRFATIGDLAKTPTFVQEMVRESKERTKEQSSIQFTLAINYGGRDEILRAVQRYLITEPKKPLTEETLSQFLDTKGMPDPELLIRTSGEKRISNFLLWQSPYTEIVTPEVLWPDFKPSHLVEAVQAYQSRDRRKGV